MLTLLNLFDKLTLAEPFAQLLEQAEVTNAEVDASNGAVSAEIFCKVPIKPADISELERLAEDTYGLSRVKITPAYEKSLFSEDNFDIVLHYLFERDTMYKLYFANSRIKIDGGSALISNTTCTESIFSEGECEALFAQTISRLFGINIDIKIEYFSQSDEEYLREQEQSEAKIAAQAAAAKPVPSVKKPEQQNAPAVGHIFGKTFSGDSMPMISINSGDSSVIAEGEVFYTEEVREINKGKNHFKKLTFYITDGEWSLVCQIFGKSEVVSPFISAAKRGARLRVMGDYNFSTFDRMDVLDVRAAELLPPLPKKTDDAAEKRVELHMHTKMSALDAITSAGDLVSRAAEWGHRAVAITDHGVVQAFPEAHKAAVAARKNNPDFKVIFGVEGYLLDETNCAPNDEVIVFDIETTGLDPKSCAITEIGAVKLVANRRAEVFSRLINPGCHIPDEITKLTGITDEMVKDAPSIETVLPEFLEFCGSRPVVAHNAKFDTSFISENAARLGLPFQNKILDTLDMSRKLFPNEKTHKLDVMCKRLNVSLENHHRAVDDATATAEVFVKLRQMEFEKNGIKQIGDEELKGRPNHIIILAKNYAGLKNLYKLISYSHINHFFKRPKILKSILTNLRDGLIIGSACEQGDLFRAVLNGESAEKIENIANFYDYLEIQPLGNNRFMLASPDIPQVSSEEDLKNLNRRILELGDKLGIPVAATCDVHFMDPDDAFYRRVLQGSQGYTDADNQAPLYFRTTEEMLAEFDYLTPEKAFEIVVSNPNKIADMVDIIQPVPDGTYPPSIENSESDLIEMCHKRAHEIYGDVLPKVVENRLKKELDCIIGNGFSVMYMIAQKLVKKSNDAGYLVGSRGSVGSSFVAYLSGITEINSICPHYVCPNCKHSEFFEKGEYKNGVDMPHKDCPECGEPMKKDGHEIPFETFLGFNGDKVPDIDLNFSGEYQATAHKYVEELFGEGYVFKAGTISGIAEKSAIGFAKKYFETKGMSVPQSEIKRAAAGIEDIKRTTGQHPGGVIVCPKTHDIFDFCPIQRPADKRDSDITTTHFDFHSIHDNLLKLDILGHDDPSTLRMLEDLTGVELASIPLDDQETMKIFRGTEVLGVTPEQINSQIGTLGVPEFGTSFTRQMLMDTMPSTFAELIFIAGLSHGTDVWLGNAQELIRNKIATLSEVISVRDDIMTFLILKGLDPDMAFKITELVRKGNAAKNGLPEEYESAMREHGVPEWYIDSCKKIKYMFPKAHAAAYVTMAFRVAYFKVHYPVEFYIAYYTVRADLFDSALMAQGKDRAKAEIRRLDQKSKIEKLSQTDKNVQTILEVVNEMYERGINFLPVDLYKSHAYKFQRIGNDILPPLNSFAGVGTAAAENIMNARAEGEFLSREDLKARAKVNKKVIETLAEHGCLNGLSESSQMSLFDF